MIIRLAMVNIVSLDGIKFIVADITKRITKTESDLEKPEMVEDKTKRKFTENNLRRLEECLIVFKMFLIKK